MATPDPLIGTDGPVVIVTGRVARRLASPLIDLLRRARDAGERLDEDLVATVRALEEAGRAYAEGRVRASLTSANGHEQRPQTDMAPELKSHAGITITEAAERLGVGERQARRLAADGRFGGRRVGKAWIVDPVAVGEYVSERKGQ